jgi:hypothetical protein
METMEVIFLCIGAIFIIWLVKIGAAAESKEKAQKNIVENTRKHEEDTNRKHKAEADKIKKAEVVAEERLALKLSNLESHLPFSPPTNALSTELEQHDKNMWSDVTRLIKNEDSEKTSLYFVKLKSRTDDKEYFKIGTTTNGVETRFKNSTDSELIEVIKVFDTEKWKAAFLEYHFLRAFRIDKGLAASTGEQSTEVGFSGHTDVVKPNSVNKISGYFKELYFYNKMK